MDSPSSNLFPANSDSPAREKLLSLRVALLRLHKTLLNMERRDYEREYGYVNTGELFRLVIDHSQFAWLHNISEFVVRIDETLAAKEPITPEYTSGERDGAAGVFRGDGLLGGQSLIDADDEFGDVVQPGELRMVDDQAEELPGVDVAVLALIVAALHVEKSLVEAQKSNTQGEKLLAGGGIAVRGK